MVRGVQTALQSLYPALSLALSALHRSNSTQSEQSWSSYKKLFVLTSLPLVIRVSAQNLEGKGDLVCLPLGQMFVLPFFPQLSLL